MNEAQDAVLIRGGAMSVNPFRKDHPMHVLRAERAEFDGLNLSGVDLTGARLARSTFANCDLSNANFEQADLSEVTFNKCNLSQTKFITAELKKTVFIAVNLDGSRFVRCKTIADISRIDIDPTSKGTVSFDRSAVRFIDFGPSWERMRFLSKIKIFVPAYTSLSLCVLYVSFCAWYNSQIAKINASIDALAPGVQHVDNLEPGLRSAVLIAAFLLLAISATTFVACPPRIIEFTRERWVHDLSRPELLYDHANWRGRWLRVVCAATLISGGALSAGLLIDGIARQVKFIIENAF